MDNLRLLKSEDDIGSTFSEDDATQLKQLRAPRRRRDILVVLASSILNIWLAILLLFSYSKSGSEPSSFGQPPI